jgi:hypothetical protein
VCLCLSRAPFLCHNLSATNFVRLLPSCFTLFFGPSGRLALLFGLPGHLALFFGLPCGFSSFLFSFSDFHLLLFFDLSAL